MPMGAGAGPTGPWYSSDSRGCGHKKKKKTNTQVTAQVTPGMPGGAWQDRMSRTRCRRHVSPPCCPLLLLPTALVLITRSADAAPSWAALRMLGQAKVFADPSVPSPPLDPLSPGVSPRAGSGNVGPCCGIEEGTGCSSGPGTGTDGALRLHRGCTWRGHVRE